MGVGPGDEVVVPVVHVLRVGRGDPRDGRDAGVLRRRPRDVQRHARDGEGGDDAEDEGGRRGRPVRQPGAGRRDRGARRAGARGRRAGRRRRCSRTPRRARSAPPRRSRSSRPRTSARSATAARSPPTTTRSPTARGRCASTARATRSTFEQVGYNSRLDELQAALLRILLPAPRHVERRPPRRRRALRARGAVRARRAAAHAARRDARRGTSTSCAIADADALAAGLTERGIGAKAYYRRPVHRQPAFATELALPGTDEVARTHLAIPMSPVLSPEQAAEVADAVRACASGST